MFQDKLCCYLWNYMLSIYSTWIRSCHHATPLLLSKILYFLFAQKLFLTWTGVISMPFLESITVGLCQKYLPALTVMPTLATLQCPSSLICPIRLFEDAPVWHLEKKEVSIPIHMHTSTNAAVKSIILGETPALVEQPPLEPPAAWNPKDCKKSRSRHNSALQLKRCVFIFYVLIAKGGEPRQVQEKIWGTAKK